MMARRAAANTLMRRLLPTSAPPRVAPPFFCPVRRYSSGSGGEGEVDLSKPPYNMISYLGDWYLTEQAMKHPGMDYRHWFVQISKPSRLEGATNEENLHYFGRILTLALPDLWLWEAVEKIYKVEFYHKKAGFGCEVDWDTADRLKVIKDVGKVTPDYYPDPKYKDYGGELVVNGKIVERRERESNPDQVAR